MQAKNLCLFLKSSLLAFDWWFHIQIDFFPRVILTIKFKLEYLDCIK